MRNLENKFHATEKSFQLTMKIGALLFETMLKLDFSMVFVSEFKANIF